MQHRLKIFHCLSIFLFLLTVWLFYPTVALAAQVTLAWDANDPAPDGYRLYSRMVNDTYDYQNPVWSGADTTCTLTGLTPDTTYHFVVRAYQGTSDSADSNEIQYQTGPLPVTYSITASARTGGVITPSGTVSVVEGEDQTFAITPDAHQVIADVLVDGQSVGAVDSFTFSNVSADHIISASFSSQTFTINASAGANGTVSPSGSVSIPYGATPVFNISANSGYRVADVLVDGSSVGAVDSYSFAAVTANHTLSASFTAIQYLITAQAGKGGGITPSGSILVNQGADQSFMITADTGYHIADVVVDGASVGAKDSCLFGNVQGAHSIEASFEPDNQAPVADAGPDQSVEENATVRLSAANSYDLDDGIAAFTWRQIAGPEVTLSSQNEPEVSFTAPETGPDGLSLVFELLVTDQSGTTAIDSCIVNVVWVNEPPTAQAGADQIVEEGRVVTLDGSNSVDPDADIISYRWEQTGGPAVVLSDDQAVCPTFIAPKVGPDGATLTFRLAVGDSGGLQDTDTALVTVTWINTPPVADAGPDQEVVEGAEGSLDGSNSRDSDDGIVAYQWTQTDGTPVTLSDATAVSPTFTAPDAEPEGVTLTFQLTVTDKGGLRHQDSCHVNVIWQNLAPKASAGPDQTVGEGSLVNLDASASTDPDDGIAGYQWRQTGGSSVQLSDPQAVSPTFTAPDVGMDGAALTFALTVKDNGGLRAEDSCVVNVTWRNQPPVAQAGPDSKVSTEATVTLDGSGSHDSDDGIATFRWRQISGTPVSIADPAAASTTFSAPAVDVETTLVFELSVTDQGGLQSEDTCSITVLAAPTAPDTSSPGIKVTDPTSTNSIVLGTTVTIQGTAWDDRQVDRIEWVSNRGPSGVASGRDQWKISGIRLSRWSNEITITAYDTAGNKTSVKLNIFAIINR